MKTISTFLLIIATCIYSCHAITTAFEATHRALVGADFEAQVQGSDPEACRVCSDPCKVGSKFIIWCNDQPCDPGLDHELQVVQDASDSGKDVFDESRVRRRKAEIC